ncbi:acyltransferase family protein [Bradyrhizobium sp. 27S5]|uniref:acyltransferase family protein n=1 Tax=Bradyrhizobium sp. 27S5 TaxID=3139728 RepID=UPI0030D27E77
MIRFGLLGCGRIAKRHSDLLGGNHIEGAIMSICWRLFFGDVVSVHARAATALAKIETEDTAVATLKFRNGALGIIEATTAARPTDLEGSLSILGEKGTVEISGFAVNQIRHWRFVEEPVGCECIRPASSKRLKSAPLMSQKLVGLQVGRALAALSVAYFHSWHVTMQFPPDTAYPIPLLRDYGELGVHFFFTISGFVICMVVTSPRFAISSFVTQRFFRIWPLWIGTSIVYLYLTRYLGRGPNQTIGAFFYSLTLLPTEGNPFYDVGWSLQHEVAFYLAAALIVPRLGTYALIAFLSLCAMADHTLSLGSLLF